MREQDRYSLHKKKIDEIFEAKNERLDGFDCLIADSYSQNGNTMTSHTHTNARINWKSINYRRYLYVPGHLCTSINCIDKINQIRPIWNEFLTFSKWMPLTFRLNFEARRFTDTVYSDYFSWNLIENFRISSENVNISFKNIFVTNNSTSDW